MSEYYAYSPDSSKPNVNRFPIYSTQILDEDESPKEPYIILGDVSLTRRNPPKTNILIADLKNKAKNIGASAIMDFRFNSYSREIYPAGLVILDLLTFDTDCDNCRSNEPNIQIVPFKDVSATAIRYVNDIPYDNQVKFSETYYSISDSDSLNELGEIRFRFNGKRDESKLYLKQEQNSMLFLAEEFSEFELLENQKDWKQNVIEGKVKSRMKYKMSGEVLEKKCKIAYLPNFPLVNRISIFDYDDGFYAKKSKVKYSYDKSYKLTKREVKSEEQDFTEKWIYDDSNRLKAVYFYKKDESKPCLVRKTEYYSEAEWNAYIKSITVYPENWEAKSK